MLTVKINRNVQNEGQNKLDTTVNAEIICSIGYQWYRYISDRCMPS